VTTRSPPEHRELRWRPSTDDVQGKAAARDVIDRGALLGRHHRVDERYMGGGEYAAVAGRLRESGGPGVNFEADAVEVGEATKPFLPADRYDGFEPGALTRLRERFRVWPRHFECAFCGRRDRTPATVGAKRPELHPVVIEERIRQSARHFYRWCESCHGSRNSSWEFDVEEIQTPFCQ